MPNIFLSPSLQTGNPYYSGGSEAQYMGYLADALEPYLRANNITYTRSRLPNTLANAIRQSNEGNYDLHLALHSNASPENMQGKLRGIQGYYYPTSTKGRQAAEDLTEALKKIYPLPELVYTVPTTTIAEVRRTKAPAVLMEIGYHDNPDDERWIKDNIQNIAAALAQGLTEYFGLPYRMPCSQSSGSIGRSDVGGYVRVCVDSPLNVRAEATTSSQSLARIPARSTALLLEAPQNGWAKVRYNAVEGYSSAQYLCACKNGTSTGRVETNGGNLNLRSAPSTNASIIGRIPDNSQVQILGSTGNWYNVSYMGTTGYVLGDFIRI